MDRYGFSAAVTEQIRSQCNITVVPGEVTELPGEGEVIVATGPLTSEPLAESIRQFFGGAEYLSFLTPPRRW